MNTYQQWEMFHLNHQERLQEAERLRLSRLCETQPSWLGRLATTLRRWLATQHGSHSSTPASLNLAQPK